MLQILENGQTFLDDNIKSKKHTQDYSDQLSYEYPAKYQECIKFISENEKVSFQDIVDHFDIHPKLPLSRMPVSKMIKELVNDGIIKKQIDEKNHSKRVYSINHDNITGSTIAELAKLDKIFLPLISEIKARKIHQSNETESVMLMYHTITVFIHIMNSYTLYSILYWPSKIKDRIQTRKLSNLVMLKMNDILYTLATELDISSTLKEPEQVRIKDIINKIGMPLIDHSFLLNPELLHDLDNESRTLGLNGIVDELIKHAWSISSKIYANKKIGTPSLANEDKLLKVCTSLAVLEEDWRYPVYYHYNKNKALIDKFNKKYPDVKPRINQMFLNHYGNKDKPKVKPK